MDSIPPSKEPSSDSETELDLEVVFRHPAGLQTARNLVELVARHWFARPTQPPTDHTMSSMSTISDSSPEVEGILRDILVFSDLQAQTSQQEELNMARSGASLDAMDIDSEESLRSIAAPSLSESREYRSIDPEAPPIECIHSSRPKPTSFGSPPSLHNGSSFKQFPSSEKSPEREIRSIFGPKVVNESLQGTESPYRVESPAVRASTTSSSQPSAQRLNDKTSLEFRSNDNNRLEQLVPLKSPLDISPVNEDVDRINFPAAAKDSARGFTQSEITSSTTSLSLAYMDITPSPLSVSSVKQSPTIKSFLPVNKSIGHNTSVNGSNRIHTDNSSSLHSEQSTLTGSINSNQLKKASYTQFFSSLRSPSPPTLPATTQFEASQTVFDLSSPNNTTDGEAELSNIKMKFQKRKAKADGASRAKRQKSEILSKRVPKSKEPKPEPAKYRLGQDLWMRILEFTPPQFLSKARLISKTFKGMVDQFDSIYVNCRIENYGWDMPSPPKGLTERQYSDLFGGKGCLEPGCDDEKASRTHWSWAKRWCHDCWKGKIEREDRALKRYQSQYGRATLTKMFECIPVGMHDSFLKPHDYIEDVEARTRQAPRLYKYYLSSEIQQVIDDYEALTPPPYKEDPNHTAAEKSAALAAHQTLMDALEEKRNEFFAIRKKANDDHMAKVQKIESAIRKKREENRTPYDVNRAARKELFLRRAQEEIPHIDSEFVKNTKAYKAATRIFRDPGTERGWQTLKPKIEKEWDELRQKQDNTEDSVMVGLDGAEDDEETAKAEITTNTDAVTVAFQSQNPSISDVRRSMMIHQHQRQQQQQRFAPQHTFGLGSLAASSSMTHFSSSVSYGNSLVASASGHASYPTPLGRTQPQSFGDFMGQASFSNPTSRNVGSPFQANGFVHQPSHYQHLPQSSSSNNTNASNFHNQSYQNSRHISIDSLLTGPTPGPHYNHNPNPFG